jgi:uncharacterized membrane protein
VNLESRQTPTPPPRGLLLGVVVASLVGAAFSAVSTADFMQFLDRQVHGLHCSFVPGAGRELGESGCRTVLMSPYSSYFRDRIWGGIPVALWAFAVFSYLVARAGAPLLRGTTSRREAGFLVAATGLPLGMSVLYFALSLHVGATCKVCVGMYLASIAAFVASVLAWRQAPADAAEVPGSPAGWFAQGVGFVALPTAVFLAVTPPSDSGKTGTCGALVQPEDPSGVMVSLKEGKTPAIEVLDPLCPSCKALDTRLASTRLGEELGLQGVLFPLDSTCNWMVTEALHPGACTVSEAILCAQGLGEKKNPAAARKVLAFAFAQQEQLREEAKRDPKALRATLEARFPEVKGCLGGAQVKNKLVKSLRWAVANALPVLTPQLFIREKRMCDEDTDLGLEYSLQRLLASNEGMPAKGGQP